jgi:hypothetical protein
MKTVNRETLKNYFRDGQMPSQRHFEALIDSMLNMNDEGFRKTVEHGEQLYAPIGHDALISFYRDQQPDDPLWQMRLGRVNDQLQFHAPVNVAPGAAPDAAGGTTDRPRPPAMTLDGRQRVGLGTEDPRARLDVRGVAAAEGRLGTLPIDPALQKALKADGQWHDLTPKLHGCQGFEVMAGAGLPHSGHFGLVHAIALSTYNPTPSWFPSRGSRRGIRQTQAWWGRRCDKIELRWLGSQGRNASYQLQIRSGCRFGDDVPLRVQLTKLWFWPEMQADDAKPDPSWGVDP